MLKKYLHDPSYVLSYESLDVDPKLTYEERPVQILDRKDKVLRNKGVPLVKVLCRNQALGSIIEVKYTYFTRFTYLRTMTTTITSYL